MLVPTPVCFRQLAPWPFAPTAGSGVLIAGGGSDALNAAAASTIFSGGAPKALPFPVPAEASEVPPSLPDCCCSKHFLSSSSFRLMVRPQHPLPKHCVGGW